MPRALTGGIDGDKPAHGFLIEQDRDIAEKSGKPAAKIKSITRTGAKKKGAGRLKKERADARVVKSAGPLARRFRFAI